MQKEPVLAKTVDRYDFRLHADSLGRLVLTESDGRVFEDVEPIRAFPISDRQGPVSICDRQGHELYWIESPAELPPELGDVLQSELNRREFVPVLKRIVQMAAFSEPSQWVVETDRGKTTFLLGSEEDVHRLDGQRAIIVDTNGIRYLIPNVRSLDPHSRRILERYL
jgi:hypothetical protein